MNDSRHTPDGNDTRELTLDEKRREAARQLKEAGKIISPIRERYDAHALRVYLALCKIACAEPVKAGYGLFESLANLIDPDATDEMVAKALDHARERDEHWSEKRHAQGLTD